MDAIKSYGFQILSVRRTKMGTMGINYTLEQMLIQLNNIATKLDKLLEKDKPKDRQDKEKAIKDCLQDDDGNVIIR